MCFLLYFMWPFGLQCAECYTLYIYIAECVDCCCLLDSVVGAGSVQWVHHSLFTDSSCLLLPENEAEEAKTLFF